MKHKLPPVMQLWHPKQLFPFFILAVVLLLLFEYLGYQALKALIR